MASVPRHQATMSGRCRSRFDLRTRDTETYYVGCRVHPSISAIVLSSILRYAVKFQLFVHWWVRVTLIMRSSHQSLASLPAPLTLYHVACMRPVLHMNDHKIMKVKSRLRGARARLGWKLSVLGSSTDIWSGDHQSDW